MGAKKRVVKLPKIVTIKCPLCGDRSKRNVPMDSSPPYFDCTKCNKRSVTPVTSCCVICAFSNKTCVPSLLMNAKVKGLEIR